MTANPLSLAAWSLHREFFANEIDQLGCVRLAGEMGFQAFEMVNTFFPAPHYRYLQSLRQTADEAGIELTLIMIDVEGNLAAADSTERKQAVRNHRKWVDIAQVLGCRWIRVNVFGDDAPAEVYRDRAAESLAGLLDYAAHDVDVIIENHGGLSSNPQWLDSLIKQVGHPKLGTLPDFGNFPEDVDRYVGVETMMPYARAVSAKCYDFDDATGNETKIDFERMVKIVQAAAFDGYIGVEYEGKRLPEREGILAGKRLLERLLG